MCAVLGRKVRRIRREIRDVSTNTSLPHLIENRKAQYVSVVPLMNLLYMHAMTCLYNEPLKRQI